MKFETKEDAISWMIGEIDDVRVRVEKLGNGCPAGTQIELLALYLPTGAIGTLATQTLALQAGGGA